MFLLSVLIITAVLLNIFMAYFFQGVFEPLNCHLYEFTSLFTTNKY